MDKIMTNMRGVQSQIINNLLGGENSEYAIFARTVRSGLALAGGVAGAYAMYNNAESVIENGGLLSEYAIETIRAPYALEIVSLAAGIVSYGVTSCIGAPVCYAMMKLGGILESMIKTSLKKICITIPLFLVDYGRMIVMEMVGDMKDIIKFALEWRSATGALIILAVTMYAIPSLAWESLVWCYENYEILIKSYEGVDKSKFLIKSMCFMVFCLLTENGLTNIKDCILNYVDLLIFIGKREYYRFMSAMIIVGLIVYNIMEMNISLFHELYQLIRND